MPMYYRLFIDYWVAGEVGQGPLIRKAHGSAFMNFVKCVVAQVPSLQVTFHLATSQHQVSQYLSNFRLGRRGPLLEGSCSSHLREHRFECFARFFQEFVLACAMDSAHGCEPMRLIAQPVDGQHATQPLL